MFIRGKAFEFASTMPSYPIFTSVISVTPFFAQVSTSDFLIAREALLMSDVSTPTPSQNSLKPPPVPVLSMTGVLKLVVLPNSSATRVENGYTVEEPTMRIWSRACAVPATSTVARTAMVSALPIIELSRSAHSQIMPTRSRRHPSMPATLGTIDLGLMTVALHFCDDGGGDALARRRRTAGRGKQDG